MTGPPPDVLLAEDNPSDAELILESLSTVIDARRVHRVHHGVEALDFLLLRGPYAGGPSPLLRLVLLDIKLPRVDGLEVLAHTRRTPPTRFAPVVMLTSSKVDKDIQLAYQHGANGYVQKPVDFVEFRRVIECAARYWLTINEAPELDAASQARDVP